MVEVGWARCENAGSLLTLAVERARLVPGIVATTSVGGELTTCSDEGNRDEATALPVSRSTSVDEALALLQEHGEEAKVLAGGQSLVPLMNFRLARPRYLIDLNRISELAFIREEDGGLAIGAMARQRAVERSTLVRDRCPLLAEAMPLIGHHQVTPIAWLTGKG